MDWAVQEYPWICSQGTQACIQTGTFVIYYSTHPAYQPYLAPSDSMLFRKIKESLRGRKFSTNDYMWYILNELFCCFCRQTARALATVCGPRWVNVSYHFTPAISSASVHRLISIVSDWLSCNTTQNKEYNSWPYT